MLKSMRRNNTIRNLIIFGIVILLASYVLVSFGQAPPTVQGDTIARIGSSKIKYRDALIAKQAIRGRFQQFNLSDENLINFTTSSLINDAVLMHGANEMGIVVSNAELRDYVVDMRTNFAGDAGYLNAEQWSNLVSYNYNLQVDAFEEWLREKELKLQKFRNLFSQAAFVPDAELKERFRLENEKIDMEILNIGVFTVRNQSTMTDDEVKAYYDAHHDEFMSGPMRKLKFSEYDASEFAAKYEPTDEEINDFYEANKTQGWITTPAMVRLSHIQLNGQDDEVYKRANEIKAKLDGGLDFAEAAKTYSEDSTNAQRGGDLGNRTRDILVRQYTEPFTDSIFDADDGAILGPVTTANGYSIVKVVSKTVANERTLEQVKPQITQNVKNEKGKQQARTAAADFLAKVRSGTEFTAAADEFSVRLYETPFFDNDPQSNLGERMGVNFKARTAAFQLAEINDVSDLIDAGNKFYVAKWTEQSEPQTLDFELSQRRIKIAAEASRGSDIIRQALLEVKAAIEADPSKSFADIIDQYDFMNEQSIITPGPFNEDTVPVQLKSENIDFRTGLYNKEVDQLVGPFKSQQDRFLVLARVIDKSSPDESKFAEDRARLLDQVRLDRGNELMASYVFSSRKVLDPNSEAYARILASVEAVR